MRRYIDRDNRPNKRELKCANKKKKNIERRKELWHKDLTWKVTSFDVLRNEQSWDIGKHPHMSLGINKPTSELGMNIKKARNGWANLHFVEGKLDNMKGTRGTNKMNVLLQI